MSLLSRAIRNKPCVMNIQTLSYSTTTKNIHKIGCIFEKATIGSDSRGPRDFWRKI